MFDMAERLLLVSPDGDAGPRVLHLDAGNGRLPGPTGRQWRPKPNSGVSLPEQGTGELWRRPWSK